MAGRNEGPTSSPNKPCNQQSTPHLERQTCYRHTLRPRRRIASGIHRPHLPPLSFLYTWTSQTHTIISHLIGSPPSRELSGSRRSTAWHRGNVSTIETTTQTVIWSRLSRAQLKASEMPRYNDGTMFFHDTKKDMFDALGLELGLCVSA